VISLKCRLITAGALLVLAQPALAGWYLMSPPIVDQVVHNEAPLSQWRSMSSYDTAMECEQDRRTIEADLRANPYTSAEGRREHPTEVPLSPEQTMRRIESAQCISDSDPRLVTK
jgi:hypothetical protein